MGEISFLVHKNSSIDFQRSIVFWFIATNKLLGAFIQNCSNSQRNNGINNSLHYSDSLKKIYIYRYTRKEF